MNEYEAIANMSDKQAAETLKKLHLHLFPAARKNGKTLYTLSVEKAIAKAVEALEERTKREEEANTAERDFFEFLKENTIGGFPVDDLKKLSIALRKTGLTPEDLKDQNKAFISGAKYAIEEVNRLQAKAIEDAFIGTSGRAEDKNIEEAKKAAQRWNAQHEPKSIQAEFRNMINRYFENKEEEK